ncbi:3342_t:CDS:2, partial [Acaulospora colombiana]
ALPLLEKAATAEDPARVINIGSIDGERTPSHETYAYSTSKAALRHLTKVMAGNLSNRNITFNSVAPGPFESKMMKKTLQDYGDAIKAAVPLNRIGSPEDMAVEQVLLLMVPPLMWMAGRYVDPSNYNSDLTEVTKVEINKSHWEMRKL